MGFGRRIRLLELSLIVLNASGEFVTPCVMVLRGGKILTICLVVSIYVYIYDVHDYACIFLCDYICNWTSGHDDAYKLLMRTFVDDYDYI